MKPPHGGRVIFPVPLPARRELAPADMACLQRHALERRRAKLVHWLAAQEAWTPSPGARGEVRRVLEAQRERRRRESRRELAELDAAIAAAAPKKRRGRKGRA